MTHCINGIDSLSTFVPFTFNPVTIEIGEQSVNVIRSCRVPIPFACIIS